MNDYDTNLKFPLVRTGNGEHVRDVTEEQVNAVKLPKLSHAWIGFILICGSFTAGVLFTLACTAGKNWK